MPRGKPKRRAVRHPVTGSVDHYTHTKTVGIRDPVTGRIIRRVPKKKTKSLFGI